MKREENVSMEHGQWGVMRGVGWLFSLGWGRWGDGGCGRCALVVMLVLMVWGMAACKKKSGSQGSSLQVLSQEGLYQQMLRVQRSMKPGQLVLTFDDGPVVPSGQGRCPQMKGKGNGMMAHDQAGTSEEYVIPEGRDLHSGDLVDFLIHHKIPATLFVVTDQYRGHADASCVLERALLSEHITVANHTWTHISSRVDPESCNKKEHDALSRLVSNEVRAAQCALQNQVGQSLDLEDPRRSRYPYFFRPPGGFWGQMDQALLVDKREFKHLVGPVGWNFGGALEKHHAADYQCWELQRWWDGATEDERKNKLEDTTLSDIMRRTLENPSELSMLEACAQQYVQEIMTQPEENRRGVVLLHDNRSQSVAMFMRYLHPLLREKGMTFVALEDVPYYSQQFQELPALELSETSQQSQQCDVPRNPCACCSGDDTSCCYGPPSPKTQDKPSDKTEDAEDNAEDEDAEKEETETKRETERERGK